MSDNNEDFKMFLQLEDVQGSFKDFAQQELQRIEAEEAEDNLVEVDDTPDQKYDEQFDETDFESFFDNDDFLFDGEEGSSKQTNPNKKGKEADQVDDDNFLSDDEEEDSQTDDQDAVYDDEQGSENEIHAEAYTLNNDDYIQLPDGRELTVEDLSSAYLEAERRSQLAREFELREQSVELKEKAVDDLLAVAALDYDQQIAYYEGMDWDNLYAINPQEYADADRHYKQVQAQKAQLLNAYRQREAAKEQAEKEKKAALAYAAVKMFKQDHPLDWEAKYQAAMNHAIDVLGWDATDVEEERRYPVIKTWLKDLERYETAKKLQTKVVRKQAPKFARSGSTTAAQQKEQMSKAKAAKAFNSGKLSHEQAFYMLED